MTNKETVLNYFAQVALLREGKPHRIQDYICEDMTWHLPRSNPEPRVFVGIDGITKMISEILPLYYQPESLEFVPYSFIAEEELVHFHFTLKAMTINNQPYENDYQILIKLRDGKLAEAWEYFDTLHLQRVLNG